jgi:prophage antirepressor-like protein
MRSRKKIAEQFQDWVCEVVEEIRKTIENLDEDCKVKINAPTRGVGIYFKCIGKNE